MKKYDQKPVRKSTCLTPHTIKPMTANMAATDNSERTTATANSKYLVFDVENCLQIIDISVISFSHSVWNRT